MANEFKTFRTTKVRFTLTNTGDTIYSQELIPAGAIITGLRVNAPTAITITGAQASVVLRVGTVAIVATTAVSAIVAATGAPRILTLATTGGIQVPVAGVVNFVESASSNSAATASYDYYIDYLV